MFKIKRTTDNRIFFTGWNEWVIEREIKCPELVGWLNIDPKVCKEPFQYYKINIEKDEILDLAANNPEKFNNIWGGLFRQLCRIVYNDLADLI